MSKKQSPKAKSSTHSKKSAPKEEIAPPLIDTAEAGDFFVLVLGPYGDPPMMKIKDFRPTVDEACGAPTRTIQEIKFTLTGEKCEDGYSICRKEAPAND